MTILSTTVARTSEDWANRINDKLQTSHDHHRQSVEGIIAAGLDLLQARTELKGHFQQMVKFELGWSQDKAEMLMAIAKNKVLANPNMFGLLPKSWSTLFLMSKAEPKVLEAKLADGTWNTETERKEVRALLKPKDPADTPIRLTPEQKLGALLDRDDGAVLLMSALRKRPKLANKIADDVARLKYVDESPTGNARMAKVVELAGPKGGLVPLAPVAEANHGSPLPSEPAAPEPLFENPEDAPPSPVFEEDADAAERSSGRSDDGSELDWRRKRAADLARWHRG
jgi:hypothetical protein